MENKDEEIREDYVLVKELETTLNKIDEKIEDIGFENIINHSAVNEVNGLIDKSEKYIRTINRKNKLISTVRNIKIFLRGFQKAFPYLCVAALITFLHIKITGDIPYYPQEQFKFAHHEETIDYTGLVSDDITYTDDKSESTNTAYYISKWEQKPDGRWYRAVKRYGNFKISSEDELLELAKNKDLNLTDVFGEVKEVKFEVTKEVSKEELEKGDYLKIVHRYKNEEDVMLIPQNFWPNFGLSVSYTAFLLVALFFTFCADEMKLKAHIEKIKENNKNIDIDELLKLFDEKKIKFEKRIHPEVTLEDPITGDKIKAK
jgi:hypothetical protein